MILYIFFRKFKLRLQIKYVCMYVCMYVYVRNVLKKTRLCENSNNGNDLDIDGDESLFYNLSCR